MELKDLYHPVKYRWVEVFHDAYKQEKILPKNLSHVHNHIPQNYYQSLVKKVKAMHFTRYRQMFISIIFSASCTSDSKTPSTEVPANAMRTISIFNCVALLRTHLTRILHLPNRLGFMRIFSFYNR